MVPVLYVTSPSLMLSLCCMCRARGLVRVDELTRAYLGEAGVAAARVQSFNFKEEAVEGFGNAASKGVGSIDSGLRSTIQYCISDCAHTSWPNIFPKQSLCMCLFSCMYARLPSPISMGPATCHIANRRGAPCPAPCPHHP